MIAYRIYKCQKGIGPWDLCIGVEHDTYIVQPSATVPDFIQPDKDEWSLVSKVLGLNTGLCIIIILIIH